MSALVAAVLLLIQELGPAVAVGSKLAAILSALETIIPAVAQFAKDLAPTVKNIITTLRGNANLSPDQLDQLDALEAKADADYDAASAAAAAEDQQQ